MPNRKKQRAVATEETKPPNPLPRKRTRLQAFLELVNCRPEEVKDIPPKRRLTTAQLKAETTRIDLQDPYRALGEMKVHFGKYQGRTLKEVPLRYLLWVLKQPGKTRWFRRFQRQVHEFLYVDAVW